MDLRFLPDVMENLLFPLPCFKFLVCVYAEYSYDITLAARRMNYINSMLLMAK